MSLANQRKMSRRFGLFLIMVYSCAASVEKKNTALKIEEMITESITNQNRTLETILQNYDKRFIPAIPGHPLIVKLGLVVSDVLKLENMEAEILVYIRQTWYDFRLRHNLTEKLKVREHVLDRIWLPDIRIVNLKNAKRFEGFGGVNMNIHPDGKIFYSQIVLVNIDCPMSLQNFPMDRQKCDLDFASFAYAQDLLQFSLEHGVEVHPVHLPQYDFVEVTETLEMNKDSKNDTHAHLSRAQISLIFQRRAGYYILQIYTPTTFLVCLSWLAFLMCPSNIADRLALLITMILSLVFLLGNINESIPHVSYAKASDWFVIVSFAFVFLTLLETMLVYRIDMVEREKQQKREYPKMEYRWSYPAKGQTESIVKDQHSNGISTELREDDAAGKRVENKKNCNVGKTIDKLCLFAFPSLYIGFAIFYWIHYKHH